MNYKTMWETLKDQLKSEKESIQAVMEDGDMNTRTFRSGVDYKIDDVLLKMSTIELENKMYKKKDTTQNCPVCHTRFLVTGKRHREIYTTGSCEITCSGCGEQLVLTSYVEGKRKYFIANTKEE